MILRTSCGGKPAWVGVYVSEHLSFACLGKTSRGKPRSKPESGNPTFRDCRGARGNVTLSFMTKCARLGSIPTPAKASEQAGSECCHSSGDWWARSVHSKEAGREDSAPKIG